MPPPRLGLAGADACGRRGLNEFCYFSYSFALRTAIELSASAAALSNCCSSQGDTPRRPFTTSRAHPTYSNLRFTDQWGAGLNIMARMLLVLSASLMILASLVFLPAVLT